MVTKLRLRATSLFFLIAILPLACTEETNPVGFDQGSRDLSLSPPDTVLIEAPTADREGRPLRTTGTSVSLLVGSDSLMESVSLIRFDSLPDTSSFERVELQLHAKKGRGDAISLRVFEVTGGSEGWSASEVTWETRPDTLAEPISEQSVPTRTGAIESSEVDTIPRIALPAELIRRWKRDPDSNAGIQISFDPEFEGEDGIARIVSHNDKIYNSSGDEILTPALFFFDSLDVELGGLEASEDAYVFKDRHPDLDGAATRARLGAGPPSRFHLRFDLDSLTVKTDKAIVVRAILSLPLEPGQFTEEEGFGLALYQITEDWTEEELPDNLDVAATSTFSETFTDTTATHIDFELGELAQDWLEGEENYGVMVRLLDETAAPVGIDVSTRESAAPPRLQIVYMEPWEFRWETDR